MNFVPTSAKLIWDFWELPYD